MLTVAGSGAGLMRPCSWFSNLIPTHRNASASFPPPIADLEVKQVHWNGATHRTIPVPFVLVSVFSQLTSDRILGLRDVCFVTGVFLWTKKKSSQTEQQEKDKTSKLKIKKGSKTVRNRKLIKKWGTWWEQTADFEKSCWIKTSGERQKNMEMKEKRGTAWASGR